MEMKLSLTSVSSSFFLGNGGIGGDITFCSFVFFFWVEYLTFLFKYALVTKKINPLSGLFFFFFPLKNSYSGKDLVVLLFSEDSK